MNIMGMRVCLVLWSGSFRLEANGVFFLGESLDLFLLRMRKLIFQCRIGNASITAFLLVNERGYSINILYIQHKEL